MASRPLTGFTLSIATATLLFGLSPTRVASTAAEANSAWADDLTPITAADWNYERAAHLLERAGFGGTTEDIRRLAALTPRQAVDSLVDFESIKSDLKPFDESGIWDPGMDPFPPSRAEDGRVARAQREGAG